MSVSTWQMCRKQGLHQLCEAGGVAAVSAGHGECEGIATGVVGGGEDIAADGADEVYHGIKGDALTGELGAQIALEVLSVGFFECKPCLRNRLPE